MAADTQYDIGTLQKNLGALVQVEIPERGDEDDIDSTIREISRRSVKLTQQYFKCKALETKLKLAALQGKGDLAASRAHLVANPSDEYSECKNAEARTAYLDDHFAEEVAALLTAELQHQNLKAMVEMVLEGVSALKTLKENIRAQIQLLEIEASLEPG